MGGVMKLYIELDLDNDAFWPDRFPLELDRILSQVSTSLFAQIDTPEIGVSVPLIDINGNKVGRAWTVSAIDPEGG
jgi:hypothetical protein